MQDVNAPPVIHFKCSHCQTQLTVDQSLAGVTGPCPSCGETMTAPVPGAPLRVRPREMRSRQPMEENPAAPVAEKSAEPAPRPARRKRSVHPGTGLSEAHNEKKETAVILKMLLAVVFVLAIVGIVVAYMKYR